MLRRFVPNFARIAAPLKAKLRKDQLVKFGALSDVYKKAMNTIQEKLILKTILALPNVKGLYNIDADACDRLVGLILLKDQKEGIAIPIGY